MKIDIEYVLKKDMEGWYGDLTVNLIGLKTIQSKMPRQPVRLDRRLYRSEATDPALLIPIVKEEVNKLLQLL